MLILAPERSYDDEEILETGDEWDALEDELTRKKKKRLVSKYSEKRFVL